MGISFGREKKIEEKNQKREREIERKEGKKLELIKEINPWKRRRSSLVGFENIT